MTVNTLATQIMSEMGEDSTDANLVTQFERWLQDSLDEIIVVIRWKWLESQEDISTVASTADYNMSIVAEDVSYARIKVDDDPLHRATRAELANLGHDLEREGRPEYYYLWDQVDESGNQVQRISFWPIPNAVFVIDVGYRTGAARLITSSEIPLPDTMLHILKDGIRYRYYLSEKDLEQGAMHLQQFRQNLGEAVERHKLEAGDYLRLESSTGVSDPWFRPVRLPPDKFRNW